MDYSSTESTLSPFSPPSPGYNYSYDPLSAVTLQAGWRFTAQYSQPITEAYVYCDGVTGTPGYLLSLQADAGGLPSGTPLAGTSSFAPVTGWNDVPFSAPVPVAAGNVYHLVVQGNAAAGITNTNCAIFELSSQPDYYYYPRDGTQDSQLDSEENGGTGWSSLAEEPVFLVNYSGSWSGNPYSSAMNISSGYGNILPAEEYFTVPTDMTIGSVGTFAAGSPFGSASAATLSWTLSNPGAVTNLATGILSTNSSLGTTLNWVDTPISPLSLSSGVSYQITFSENGSYFYLFAESTTLNQSPFTDASYGGTGSYEGNTYMSMGPCAPSCAPGPANNPSADLAFRFLVVNFTPTPTPTSTPALSCDTFYVSKNILVSGQGAVTLQVDSCQYPGPFSLKIYNSAGEHIKTLDDRRLFAPLRQTYSWDGTNKNGSFCASGVYVLFLVEPAGTKTKRIIWVR